MPNRNRASECNGADGAKMTDESLFEMDGRHLVSPHWWSTQSLTPGMRMMLVDWMIEVVAELNLLDATLHSAVRFVDMALNPKNWPPIERAKLQLVGIAGLWIAAKLEESVWVGPKELTKLTDRAFTVKQLCDMEREVLRRNDYRPNIVTADLFAARIMEHCPAGAESKECRKLVRNYARMTLLSLSALDIRTAQLAAAAVAMAHQACNIGFHWTPEIERSVGCSWDEIAAHALPCVFLVCKNPPHHAYSDRRTALHPYRKPSPPDVVSAHVQLPPPLPRPRRHKRTHSRMDDDTA